MSKHQEMSVTMHEVSYKVEAAMIAAVARGAHSKRELETVAAVELALHGLEIHGTPCIQSALGGDGVRVHVEIWVKEISRGEAKVYDLERERVARTCQVCFGFGCLWCRGAGWEKRKGG